MLNITRRRTRNIKLIILLTLFSPLFQACGILNPNRMLSTDKSFESGNFLDTISSDFTINQGDVINVLIFPKKGYNLIESQIAINNNSMSPQTGIASLDYAIDQKGEANLPIIGTISLLNLTIRQAELKLMEAYAPYYNDPFVNIKITNKYVTVYRGSAQAQRVLLDRPDITLMEAIGMAGGIPDNGKSANVKVIRFSTGNTSTEIVDLSNMNGILKAQAFVKPNDIIYIEPVISGTLFRELSPIITAVSSIVVIYAFFYNINK